MKKIISFAALLALLMGLISCDIEASRSFSGTLNVVVTNLPVPTGDAEEDFTALALYCNKNEWNVDNVNGSEIYIVENKEGTATFVLEDYSFAEAFLCQFVLLADKSVKLSSATWWQTALSGSSNYSESENNMNYSFTKAASGMTLTVDAAGYSGKDRIYIGVNPFTVSGI